MEIILIFLKVVAVIADFVTIFMFIEYCNEKRSDKNEK